MNIEAKKYYTYDIPVNTQFGSSCSVKQAWARVPAPLTKDEKQRLRAEIKKLLKEKNAVLVAHYYVDDDLQDLAMETGGCVGDSLEMARFGRDHPAENLIVAGVRFMGETAKILSPEKRIFMPDLDANCSLDLGCPVDDFTKFCKQYPDRIIVVYANTSAAVKAAADWVVTSSIGLEIVTHLNEQGKKIIWGPDRHLGSYIQRQTNADMLLWQGSCMVHNEFKGEELQLMRNQHPEAKVLVHPESPASVVAQADIVGSTTQLINAAKSLADETFIVATDLGILHALRTQAPEKTFLAAPTSGEGATCKSCAFCPWMAMNGLLGVRNVLLHQINEINVPEDLILPARKPIDRMLSFAAQRKTMVKPTGTMMQGQKPVPRIGPA